MPVFSIISLIICIYILISNDELLKKYSIVILITSVVELLRIRGYFFPLGDYGIGTQIRFWEYVTTLFNCFLIYKFKLEIEWNLYWKCGLFFCAAIISGVYELLYNFEGPILPRDVNIFNVSGSGWDLFIAGIISRVPGEYTLLDFLKGVGNCGIVVFNIICIKNFLSLNDIEDIVRKIILILKGYVVVIYIEFFLKNIIDYSQYWPELQILLCGSFKQNDLNVVSEIRGEWYTLIGFSQESSFVVMALGTLLLLLIISNETKELYQEKSVLVHNSMFSFAFVSLAMLMCGGFSSLWYLFNIIIIFVLIKTKFRKELFLSKFIILSKLIIGIVVLAVVALMVLKYTNSIYWDRILMAVEFYDVFINSGFLPFLSIEDKSILARFSSIVYTLSDVSYRPFWGLGVGMEYAHSFSVTMLADFGLIGSFFWWLLVLYKRNESDEYDSISMFIFIWIVGIMAGDFSVNYLKNISLIIIIDAFALYSDRRIFR